MGAPGGIKSRALPFFMTLRYWNMERNSSQLNNATQQVDFKCLPILEQRIRGKKRRTPKMPLLQAIFLL